MKNTILLLAAILAFAGYQLKAQINSPISVPTVTTNSTGQTSFDNAWKAVLNGGISNGTIEAYGTYAPKAPKGSKFGGGIFGAYNFNENVAAGLELDWLGQLSLVSCNLEGQAPFHLGSIFPFLAKYSFFQNLVIDPLVIGGVAMPYSGQGKFNGSPMVVADAGGGIQYGHALGGRFNAGVVWGKWIGQGPYAVARYHAFAGWGNGLPDGSGPSVAAKAERFKDRIAHFISPSTRI